MNIQMCVITGFGLAIDKPVNVVVNRANGALSNLMQFQFKCDAVWLEIIRFG